jgi:hypothetical protein
MNHKILNQGFNLALVTICLFLFTSSQSTKSKWELLTPGSTCSYIDSNWMLKGSNVYSLKPEELNHILNKKGGCCIGFLSDYENRKHDSFVVKNGIIDFSDTTVKNCAIAKLPKKLIANTEYVLWLSMAIDSKKPVSFTSILAFASKTPLGKADQIQIPHSTSYANSEISVERNFLTNKWKMFATSFTAKGGENFIRINHPGSHFKEKICLRQVLITEKP